MADQIRRTAPRQTWRLPLRPTTIRSACIRKNFTLKKGMLDDSRRVYINFQGVESAYYVYVNGHEVGYSEDTFSPHKFDITDYLQEGDNFLAVKVLEIFRRRMDGRPGHDL